MEAINQYLFVYGTLLVNDNAFAAYLAGNCRFYGKGKLKAKLYDIGEYPGLISAANDDHFVYGDIYSMPNPDDILKTLDEYEGFGNNKAQPNEFVRRLIPIESSDQLLTCWVYEYNLPVDTLTVIISGDYLEYRTLGLPPAG